MNIEQLLVGVINVESHHVDFSVLDSTSGNILLQSSRPVNLIKPQPGWVEVDAEHIWTALRAAIDEVIEQLKTIHLSKDNIRVVGVLNEKETVLAWDSTTDKPVYNAIHYTDTRSDAIIHDFKSYNPNVFHDIENSNGLKVTSSSSALKFKWIINNTKNVKQLIGKKTFKFGTLDTWLVWKLTKGNLYTTDVTNASRTLLMDLKSLEWSSKACRLFNVPISLLPTIQSSSKNYGIIEETSLSGISIGSVFVNHQAAVYGLDYTQTGQVISRYGESCTVSCLIGPTFMKSNNGLITTVAYKIDDEPAVYAFEGWMLYGGKAITWLQHNMKMINCETEIQSLNIDSSDVYFVPAFNGLAAPHWQPDARGIICGMTLYTNKEHLIRATMESMCFHTKDICVAFEKDTGVAPFQLIVDGKYSVYNNLLNYQADILGKDVIRSRMTDMAKYGSARAAARVVGIEFNNHQWQMHTSKPTTTDIERKLRYIKWLKAVRRSFGLSKSPQVQKKLEKYDMTKLISTAYLIAMMGIMVVSDKY